MKQVAVLGLGLIGGSVGLALRERDPELRIIGIDRSDVIRSGPALRAAHELVDRDDAARVDAALASELVVLAAPVSVIMRELPGVLDRAGVVIDCGSTKRAICAAVASHPRRAQFVPSHPMAGLPEGGIEHAHADLFEGRRWIVCGENSAPEALQLATSLIRSMGAVLAQLTIEEHDRAVARTSHVPQLLASALLVCAAKDGAERAAGPAFASATRVAGGPEAMWRDIFATNADEIASALGDVLSELESVAEGLARDPASLDAARALLARARELRRARG